MTPRRHRLHPHPQLTLPKTHPFGRDGHGLNWCWVLEEDRGSAWDPGDPLPATDLRTDLRSGLGLRRIKVGRTGSGGTYLEDLHLLQHELLHFLVILGQHDDLLYCPAVWNGPGRTSAPSPTRAPTPLGQWSRSSMMKLKGFHQVKERDQGDRHRTKAKVCPQTLILGPAENKTLACSYAGSCWSCDMCI
jgi:hypothetical protein